MIRIGFALLLVYLTLASCRDSISRVPDVPVYITININQPAFFDLSVPAGWAYVTGGSRGIIVYRKSTDEFIALERHSPYQPEDNCAVVVNDDNVIISDPCSDSQWLIMDGTIVQGPTSFALKTYSTTYSNSILTITN